MYTVVYHGQHTCKDNNGVDSSTDGSETNTQSSSDSRSTISTTCTDPYDHQPSIDDNKLSENLQTWSQRACMSHSTLTPFAPLDLDSWELDALLDLDPGN
ncbi:hypothetical protein HU200_067027 [Digitaria exilis]|uniref:Uncharacterized protein n=1 Tax=Digitaria exilis TaxID=1010633 RepID=A0A834ZW89_9POAL|nr:hypothetical protein HU200_067027 [Digitaria exilis]